MAIIAIDFDGTCVTNEFPKVGRDVGAQKIIRQLVNEGHRIVLFTVRSGDALQDAVDWFDNNNIPLYGINENPDHHSLSNRSKVFADIYIDDKTIGAPLLYVKDGRTKPYIDWNRVEQYFIQKNYIKGVFNDDYK